MSSSNKATIQSETTGLTPIDNIMFLETTYYTNGKEVKRFINLKQVVSMGVAEGDKADQGFKTVLFMPNGYAMFSQLSTEEIIVKTLN